MNKVKLSVVIPSYKDPLLHKTIESLLENSELEKDELEIIAVLDGYWPEKPLPDDPRVRVVHLGRNVGMREAINSGVRVARGEFLMRSDEHCTFSKGYDRVIVRDCGPNEIMTFTRYFLDVKKWEVMDMPPVNYLKLAIKGKGPNRKFTGADWPEMDEKMKDVRIGESMAMQGSMWAMPKAWWEKVIIRLETEVYGPLYQDSHEMIFKTWKAGGRFVLNKNGWHSHKHRSFARTHNNGSPENPSDNAFTFKAALDIWEEYYEKEIRPRFGV